MMKMNRMPEKQPARVFVWDSQVRTYISWLPYSSQEILSKFLNNNYIWSISFQVREMISRICYNQWRWIGYLRDAGGICFEVDLKWESIYLDFRSQEVISKVLNTLESRLSRNDLENDTICYNQWRWMGYLRDNEDFCFEIVKWESIYLKDFLTHVVRNPSKAQRQIHMNLVLWRSDLENATSDEDE